MTESEWQICDDPQRMLNQLARNNASQRKLRLFAVACCRRILKLMTDDRCREAVDVAKLYAEDCVSAEKCKSASVAAASAAQEVARQAWDRYEDAAALAAEAAAKIPIDLSVASHAANAAAHDVASDVFTEMYERADAYDDWFARTHKQESTAQSELLRDLFGNPFRPEAPTTSTEQPTPERLHEEWRDDRGIFHHKVYSRDKSVFVLHTMEYEGGDGPLYQTVSVYDAVSGNHVATPINTSSHHEVDGVLVVVPSLTELADEFAMKKQAPP